MQKLLIIFMFAISFTVFTSVVAPVSSYAIDSYNKVCNDSGARGSTLCKSRTRSNPLSGNNGILIKITDIIAYLSGAIAIIMIIIAGIKFVTANGDSNAISDARGTIMSALIGLAVIILARTIINFVIGKL